MVSGGDDPVPKWRAGEAAGHTDMRKGFDGLALLVQETLKRDPHSAHPSKKGQLKNYREADSPICLLLFKGSKPRVTHKLVPRVDPGR